MKSLTARTRTPRVGARAGQGRHAPTRGPRRLRSAGVAATSVMTRPDIRRAHPATPHCRPGGVPAPSLRPGALPAHRIDPCPPLVQGPPAAQAGWRLTTRAVGLIMAALAILMLTAGVVVVTRAVQVTSAGSGSPATRGPASSTGILDG